MATETSTTFTCDRCGKVSEPLVVSAEHMSSLTVQPGRWYRLAIMGAEAGAALMPDYPDDPPRGVFCSWDCLAAVVAEHKP